jgi:hypothetical protein
MLTYQQKADEAKLHPPSNNPSENFEERLSSTDENYSYGVILSACSALADAFGKPSEKLTDSTSP